MNLLNPLNNTNCLLKTTAFITLEYENDTVIASLDEIDAFAYADTASEAIEKFCDEIVHVYEDLKNDRDNLGPLPRKWLQFLEELRNTK